MSTYQQPSDGSFELYDNTISKGLRQTTDTASPPGGPTFHPPIISHEAKKVEELRNELVKSHHDKIQLERTVAELQNRLQITQLSDPLFNVDSGLDDYKDARIRHLDREKTVLQASLLKKQRIEERMKVLSEENNALKDQLHNLTSEITGLTRVIKEQEIKILAQKDTINRLQKDRDLSSIRKGDDSDTTLSPPQSTSLSPPASTSLTSGGAASVGSEGSYTQELEHLHAMVDMLRSTVLEQRRLFLNMGSQTKKMTTMAQSRLAHFNSSGHPASHTLIAQPVQSRNASSPGSLTHFSVSLSNGISPPQTTQQPPRLAEENSEKQPLNSKPLLQPQMPNNGLSDIDLSRNELPASGVRKFGEEKVNLATKFVATGNLNPSVENFTTVDSENKISLTSNSGTSLDPTVVYSSHDGGSPYVKMKEASDGGVSINTVVDNETNNGSSCSRRMEVGNQINRHPIAVSGATVSNVSGMMRISRASLLELEDNDEDDQYSSMNNSYENINVGVASQNPIGHDGEEYVNTAVCLAGVQNAKLLATEPRPHVCNPMTPSALPTVPTKIQPRKKLSVTEVIKPSSPLIDPSSLPVKSKTEIIAPSGYGQPLQLNPLVNVSHPNKTLRQKSHLESDEGDNFSVQYPPTMLRDSSPNNQVMFPNSDSKTTAAAVYETAPSMLYGYVRSNSHHGSTNTTISENWSAGTSQQPQQILSPRLVNPNQVWPHVPALPAQSSSNTLSNITDVTSTYDPYAVNRIQTRINGGNVPFLQQQYAQQQIYNRPPHLQQQQQHLNSNFNHKPSTSSDTNVTTLHEQDNRLCPVCHSNFPTISLEDFQAHVYDCFDNENGPETLMADQQPSIDVNLADFNRQTRSCPMCQANFALTVSQNEFEAHVHRHFGDENFELVA